MILIFSVSGFSLHAEIMLFATLFTSYFTLEHRVGSGPSGAEIFEITPVLIETFILLTSSFVIGLGYSCNASWKKKGDDGILRNYTFTRFSILRC